MEAWLLFLRLDDRLAVVARLADVQMTGRLKMDLHWLAWGLLVIGFIMLVLIFLATGPGGPDEPWWW
jgi:hypothetical protein